MVVPQVSDPGGLENLGDHNALGSPNILLHFTIKIVSYDDDILAMYAYFMHH